MMSDLHLENSLVITLILIPVIAVFLSIEAKVFMFAVCFRRTSFKSGSELNVVHVRFYVPQF